MQNVVLSVVPQNLDIRSKEIQYLLSLKNGSAEVIRLVSIRIFKPETATVEHLSDTDLEADTKHLHSLYSQLTMLLRPLVREQYARYYGRSIDAFNRSIDAFQESRTPDFKTRNYGNLFSRKIVAFKENRAQTAKTRDYQNLLDQATSSWDLIVNSSEDAEIYYNEFLKCREVGDIKAVFLAKMGIARRLEERIGKHRDRSEDSKSDRSKAVTEYIAEIEPQGEFKRNYVIQYKRRFFNPASYTLLFDCLCRTGEQVPAGPQDKATGQEASPLTDSLANSSTAPGTTDQAADNSSTALGTGQATNSVPNSSTALGTGQAADTVPNSSTALKTGETADTVPNSSTALKTGETVQESEAITAQVPSKTSGASYLLEYHKSASVTAPVAPHPLAMTCAAAIFAVLGLVLAASVAAAKDWENMAPISWSMLITGPTIVDVASAILTAIFFYNLYEWTELGRRLAVVTSGGWRSALLIGGASGLLNQKVVAALQDFFG
jgi:hypothetical protein